MMNKIDATPNVVFLNSLRNSGYNNYTAIADIIDNSLDNNVNSKNVYITINHSKESGYENIIISDDGCGMSYDVLCEALKLGAVTGKNRQIDLGSYGTGLKAASLSMGKKFEIYTKSTNDELYIANYDLDNIIQNNNFEIPVSIGNDEDFEYFKEYTKSNIGTIVKISKLDRITNNNKTSFIDNLMHNMGLIFQYFIIGNRNIFINDKKVEGVDPMARKCIFSKEKTYLEKFSFDGANILFSVYQLSKVDEQTDLKLKRNIKHSGIYIYRNHRLVGSGLDFDIIKKGGDGYANGIRVELFVDGNCDNLFGSTFNKIVTEKNKKDINPDFIKLCKEKIGKYCTDIKKDEQINRRKSVGVEREPELKIINDNINNHPFFDKTKSIDHRIVSLGEGDMMFRTIKEYGKTVVEINKDHAFWDNFLKDQSIEVLTVIYKLYASMALASDKIDFNDEDYKKIIMDEFFYETSQMLRKLIKY